MISNKWDWNYDSLVKLYAYYDIFIKERLLLVHKITWYVH